eukprot:TRINITY_DN9014_c0_g1_i3.p1 TRINITY_DN9014_c0_g1~~TRINITY_DN9014_c0_g1_i3.p1  ORF type:complete len:411 (+),score=41.29 TRINITY_DN9014_c0_g1_i3:137-1369(+)
MCIRDRQSTGSQQVSMADNKPERLSQHDRIERLVECIQETDAKFDPELEPAVEEDVWFFAPGTTFSSAMTLANSAIGAGILSFPYAFKAAGVAAGIVVTFTLCLLMGGALNIIARCCAARPELKSYGDIVRFYLEGQYGKRAILVFDALMIFYVFGACVGYLMILYDMGHPVLQRIWEIETVGTFFKAVLYPDGFLETTLSRAIIIGFPATCFVLPLSALRDITKLGPSSTFAIVAVCYLGAVVITKSAQHISDAGFPTNECVAHAAPGSRAAAWSGFTHPQALQWPSHSHALRSSARFKSHPSTLGSGPGFEVSAPSTKWQSLHTACALCSMCPLGALDTSNFSLTPHTTSWRNQVTGLGIPSMTRRCWWHGWQSCALRLGRTHSTTSQHVRPSISSFQPRPQRTSSSQ